MRTQPQPRGFTLIEVLTATAMISIVIIVATSLLVVFFRSEREVRQTLYLNDQARYIVSLIAERSADGYIDYDFYATTPSAQPDLLAVRNVDGQQTVFWFRELNGMRSLWMCDDKIYSESCNTAIEADWSLINSDTVFFPVSRFTVYPDLSPYAVDAQTGSAASNTAPYIQIGLQVQEQETGQTSELIQTALTPRYYVR